MAGMPEINDSNFEAEALKAPHPVVVDFTATWCGPCKMLGPILKEYQAEYEGKLKIYSMDLDANQKTAVMLGITTVPTLVFLKDGQEVARCTGYRPKPALAQYFQKLIPS